MAIEAQGTKFEIESGSGVAKNISAISLGAISEITSSGHGLSVGDVVTFASVGGATGFNGLSAMVIGSETNTFFVPIDSSEFETYTEGGTATPATYTEVGEVVDFDGPGATANTIDVTHLGSDFREKLMGLRDWGELTLTCNLDIDDTGQQAVEAACDARSQIGFRITYSSDDVQTFDGYVLGTSISGGVDDKVNYTITIAITGDVSTNP